ncbi:PDZ domain-containing protein [Brevibacillus humidisoli]|uniref:PDZ domain-containing protein n=1 Tax=Brevibacillus humidisoli TaxID=2895522 RepID=UPI001E2AFCED|nr:PDZ domain-containing protein [Brevibacillus humidisoli]UFJ40003.1 PDZ domain-containing protein [Brevibacillus humidisoli]
MLNGWGMLSDVLYGIVQLLLNPLLYVFALFIYLQYRKQMAIERQLFAVRLHIPLVQTIRSIGWGLVGGLLVSVIAAALGVVVQVTDIWMTAFLAILLAFFRLRFLCLAYAAGLLTLLHLVALLWPQPAQFSTVGVVWGWLMEVQPVPLLALVALLHLAEAMLVRAVGSRDASPLFIGGKRGRIIGAYQLQSFWLTPLLLFVPTDSSSGVTEALYSGWPLFSSEWSSASFALLLLPAVTGFSDLTQAMTPRQKVRESSRVLTWYAILLLGLSYAAVWLPALVVLAALFAVAGHEALVWYSRRREQALPPYFIQSSKGIKVMAVIPNTPAEELGILPGEIIVKVNGISVRDKEQLYPALQANPAFCKMEVLTYQQEVKFLQCAVYAGNHHQLGIIVVPDQETQYYMDIRKLSLVQLLGKQLQKLKMGA